MMNHLRRTFSRQSVVSSDEEGATEDITKVPKPKPFLDIFTVSAAADNVVNSSSRQELTPGGDADIVTFGGTGSDVTEFGERPVPPSFLAFSIVSAVFLNPLFGGIGIYLSWHSRKAMAKGDRHFARALGRGALAVCIVGLGINLTLIILLAKHYGANS